MIPVVPLSSQHINKVAQLHLDHLRTPYRGYAGKQLLRYYYRAILGSDSACGYVAEIQDQVAGFVCGVWDPDSLRSNLLKKYLTHLVFWGSFQVVTRPSLLRHLLHHLSGSDESTKNTFETGYELRPIVVDTQFQGRGTSEQLTTRLLEDAAQRGYDSLYLVTESDNGRANAFYHKMGFGLIGTYQVRATTYFRYEKSTKSLNV